MKIKRALPLPLLLAAICIAQAPPLSTAPAAHPKFTIGKDTTLIDGPLNPDGTINYVAAINNILSQGVTNENNAAIPLLSIKDIPMYAPTAGPSLGPTDDAIAAALHASLPATRPSFQIFETYMARKAHPTDPGIATPDEQEKYSRTLDGCQSHPWNAADHPDVAEWLKQNDAALRAAEMASRMPKFFEPFVSASNPPKTSDAFPPLATLSSIFRHAFFARAMLAAGDGDLPGALEYLQTTRRAARLLDQEHLLIFHLIGVATEFDAFRAYAALANGTTPKHGDFDRIRKEINAFEPLLESDPKRDQLELMFALDGMMQIIRGDAQPMLKILSFSILTGSGDFDLGDLPNVNWDVALREAIRLARLPDPPADLPFAERQKAFEKMAKDAGPPPFSLFDDSASGKGDDLLDQARSNTEKFLKRRTGEDNDAYSKRIGAWLVGWDPAQGKRFAALHERCRLVKKMALVAVDLAEYRFNHGNYPDTLSTLGQPALDDPFSGGRIHYESTKAGFTLYSVGINGKDENGKGDDIVIQVNR